MKWRAMGVAALSVAMFSCSSDSDSSGNNANNANNGNNGKGDDTGRLVCDVGNAAFRDVDFTTLGDPIARKVLRSGEEGDCPTSYGELMARLREVDSEGCDSGPKAGIRTWVVSETAQILNEPTSYRAVVTRKCDERKEEDLFFSLFGVTVDRPTSPNVEIMAFDETVGVYNYYTLEGGEFEFHGDSNDFVQPGANQRCAACHTGGGLVFKELDTPWVHWEGHHTTPGSSDLVNGSEDLGSRASSASSLESLVKSSTRRWNEVRLTNAVAAGDVKEILRPLFCSVEVNLDNGSDFENSEIRRVNFDLLLDPELKGFGGISTTEAAYQAAIAEIGQEVPGTGKADTIFRMTYPERAFADNDYVSKLSDVVGDEFIRDVLMVQFTRPALNPERCALLDFAPAVDDSACCRTCSSGQACGDTCISADATCNQAPGCACGPAGALTGANITAGFIANLEAANPAQGSAAAELLANLQEDNTLQTSTAVVDAYVDACEARDQQEYMNDVMVFVSSLRDSARERHVFEFAQTMADDTIDAPSDARFDPTTCQLIGQGLE